MNRTGFYVALIVGAVLVSGALSEPLRERAILLVSPSAERAYAYGMRHFNSLDADTYNLSHAEYFLSRAATLDPAYPYVHHQLARIHFLRGAYPAALEEINAEIANDPEKSRAATFYMRGLIEGYLGDYAAAVQDYKQYVTLDPTRWEGRTDYAWVLIKTGDFAEALSVIDTGLRDAPDNPWLLSMRATILYELGNYQEALIAARKAYAAVNGITEEMWLKAYPGNAPEVASTGIQTLHDAARANLEKIEQAVATK